ncbi:hypothetical protein BKA61DRAFT_683614 [Leptodontidium sp. MPI-SDFR-AT-0119]|nr:hypothetical protein BKA61DRAFT_683614 [Leptodontidium sp. MPI-SDFR-AT-0119]
MASLLRDFDILLLGVLAKDTEAKLAKLEGSPALLLIVNRKAWRVFDRQIHFQILLLQFFGEFPPKLYDKLRTSQTKAYKSISNDSDSDMVKRAGPAATTATAAPTTINTNIIFSLELAPVHQLNVHPSRIEVENIASWAPRVFHVMLLKQHTERVSFSSVNVKNALTLYVTPVYERGDEYWSRLTVRCGDQPSAPPEASWFKNKSFQFPSLVQNWTLNTVGSWNGTDPYYVSMGYKRDTRVFEVAAPSE